MIQSQILQITNNLLPDTAGDGLHREHGGKKRASTPVSTGQAFKYIDITRTKESNR